MADITSNLIEQVNDAIADKTALNLIGGNTKHFIGRQPVGQAVSLKNHTGVISYRPSELVITARAGTTIAEIQAQLANNNQTLVGEPPAFNGKATLGGSVAAGISGASRPFWGSLRDAILGVKLINGYGEHLRFGGQVMKNVAGYDVSRLQAGAFGAFGIITEVSLRVRPKSESTTTLVFECGAASAIRRMRDLSVSAHPLSASAWCSGQLFIRLSGSQLAINHSIETLGGETLENQDLFWRSIRNFRHPFFAHRAQPLYRLSLSPAAPHYEQLGDTLIDWAGGVRWVYSEQSLSTLANLAALQGGHAACYRPIDRHAECFHPQSDTAKRIHQNLKMAFDPHSLFNPGRMYSWLGRDEAQGDNSQ
ncbi:Glycolate dehydrogenase, FAD-binding subunit GlcE [Grimontia indica]|uniref:Glycolate dehydrogenase, FAD-binding subunit GlcE n=1 Tax=Grimontia indica TaxID=1056512 RepID=R1IVH6_9GAMM|nr:glycolate oxidase subunit GlcE [Grimontia indica]EOD81472.1 Glycolate dehydrogenase, FAD-binding subunit GlcE [Grimontia indica]